MQGTNGFYELGGGLEGPMLRQNDCHRIGTKIW